MPDFDSVDQNKLWKILKEMGILDHLTCFLRNLYASQDARVRTRHWTMDWFQIGKGEHQGCILSPCLFYMQSTLWEMQGQMKHKLVSRLPGEIAITSDIQMTPPLWQKAMARGERDDRGWDVWMASPTGSTWVCASSGSWWWTGKPGMLLSMGSQKVRHGWVNWTVLFLELSLLILKIFVYFYHLNHGYKTLLYIWSIYWYCFCLFAESCPAPYNPMNCNIPGSSVLHYLPKFAQTHIYWVGDVIWPTHPLSSPPPPAFILSQHQGLSQWFGSLHQVAQVLELQLQSLSFQWIFKVDFL